MNEKKRLSNLNPNLNFSPNLPEGFVTKYKTYSNDELATEINKTEKRVSQLKSICAFLQQDYEDYKNSREGYSNSFEEHSNYLSSLQEKEQNLNIKFSYSTIETLQNKIINIRKNIKKNLEETTVYAIDHAQQSGGIELLQQRTMKLQNSLDMKQNITVLRELEKEIEKRTKTQQEQSKILNKLTEQYENNWERLNKLREENQQMEEELEKINKNASEITRIKEEIEALKRKKEEIDQIKTENEDLLSQIEEEKLNRNKRKMESILMLPSAQTQTNWPHQYESQISSMQELIELRDKLKSVIQERKEKLEIAKSDVKEAITVIQATMDAINNYQQSLDSIV